METMRLLQYICSILGTGCLVFTYIQMAKKNKREKG
ncbi:hypothetical protein BkAM31D_13290 [Halalkalibacter krulwichiae]|uniref:Lipoprotein n=1 Tax=Halalkalibacter krulwichiae TaxID=199441 RepID=A0A1X9MBA2_9BACI|nr:hypothetical protein BkAM31D_13290 [Halalkalibacter krulwichiae]